MVRKIDFSVFPPLAKTKERAIRYASHEDSAIYATYSRILSDAYEGELSSRSIGSSVLAYRGGIGYNVPFANELFKEVKSKEKCHVVCLDVSGFFDNLNHEILKKRIKSVPGVITLPSDWYKIVRRTTSYEYVDREDIESALGKISGKRICDIDTFRRSVRKLIKKNDAKFGIPQGTPLSGLFANIYMIEFDTKVHEFVVARGAPTDAIVMTLPW